MPTMKQHRENLKKMILSMNDESKIKFGAWSCFPFTKDPSIGSFFNRMSKNDTSSELNHIINQAWAGKLDLPLSKKYFDDINAIDWDVDALPEAEEAHQQGAADFLAALSFLMKSVFDASKDEHLLGCAENLINRIDYLADFADDDDLSESMEKLSEQEFRNQIDMAEDLVNTKVTEITSRHSELIAAFESNPV